MKRLNNILVWSVISAAFIGPGTVTTAATAGATYGFSLLWALVFSTLATFVLQEAAARLTITSGKNLGQAMVSKPSGIVKVGLAAWIATLAIALGGIAYEAGNILGAVAGGQLIANLPSWGLAVIISLVAGILLWTGHHEFIAKLLGALVGIMGIVFVTVALLTPIDESLFMQQALTLQIPNGATVLVLGLIGTTIVPYNLFLGSGLGKGKKLADMRLGLAVAIILGGAISMAILITGTQVKGEFSYEALAMSLEKNIGPWATITLGAGLFAAGITSAMTAPLAAAITLGSVFGEKKPGHTKWQPHGLNFRATWMLVLGVGLIFGVSGIKPIPAIILAQALNGLLLPIIALLLFIYINDPQTIPEKYLNGPLLNIVTALVVWVTTGIGINNLLNAINKVFPLELDAQIRLIIIATTATAILFAGLITIILRQKRA